jgi:tetratricopeptide (TPR) repeat protein
VTKKGAIVAAAAAAFLVHLLSLGGDFVYDDNRFVVSNEHVLEVGDPLRFFTDIETTSSSERPTKNIYRPLRTLSYAVLGALGAEEPWPYHLLSVTLHALAVALLTALLLRAGAPPTAALVGALVFGLHPTTVETVAFISSLGDLWCHALALASVLFYARGSKVAAFVFYAGALFGKEHAVVVPLLWGAWDLTMQPEQLSRGFLTAVLPGVAVAVGFWLWREHLGFETAQTKYLGGEWGTAACTMLSGLGFYAATTIFPTGPTFDARVDIQDSLFSVPVLLGVAVLALLIWAIVRGHPRVRLAALWFLIALGPVSNVIVPLKIPTADRFLYLSLAGLAFAVAHVWTLPRFQAALRPAGWIALGLVGALTLDRIGDWKDADTLREARKRVDPKSPTGVWDEAGAYARAATGAYIRGDWRAGDNSLLEAVRLYDVFFRNTPLPETLQARIELADLLFRAAQTHQQIDHPEAVTLYEDALNHYSNAHALHRTGQGRHIPEEVQHVADRILSIAIHLLTPDYQDQERVARWGWRAADFLEANYGRRENVRRAQLLLSTGVRIRGKDPKGARGLLRQALEIFETAEKTGADWSYPRAQCNLYLGILKDRDPDRQRLEQAHELFARIAESDGDLRLHARARQARVLRLIGELFERREKIEQAMAILTDMQKKPMARRVADIVRAEKVRCEQLLR